MNLTNNKVEVQEEQNIVDQEEEVILLVGEELISVFRVALPVALTTLMIHSKSIISMLFLGRMGKIELAGGSLAIGFANVTGFSVIKGLCMGMEPICSQAFGAKRLSVLTHTYIKMFLLLFLISIPVTFLWLNVEPVLLKLGQDPIILKVARAYLIYSIPDLIAHAHVTPLRSFLRTQGLNSPATLVAMCSTAMHLPLTYLLVTHFKLNVKGLALASSLYTINMNVGLLVYLFFSKTAIKPWMNNAASGPSSSFLSALHGWGPLLSLAFPSLFSVCLEWWWYEIILFMSGLLANPEACVAAMGILIQTTGIIYVFPYSLSLSISQRVGHELGSGQHSRARFAALVGVCIGFVYGTLAFGLTLCVRSLWGKFYTSDPQVLHMISGVLPILGLAEVGNSSQTAACGALTGSARPKVGVRINLAAFYLVGIPCSALLAFKLHVGFQGLWLGLIASQAACLGMMIYTLYQTDWKYQAKRADDLTSVATGDKDDDGGGDGGTNLIP
ncbi:OLC1v1033533C1 [Oldenlandia corymbosa var. corymbosa]|uniref:Protein DETOXIFICATION n=1 Tax=Oldenlandia corymbosa var. corymbosa TaxID=529605 RepID=A0AAV1CNG8_OLDCO|nr:OLC1v1033533C1 [Oldenlandia corymbosa var. corymbosa]